MAKRLTQSHQDFLLRNLQRKLEMKTYLQLSQFNDCKLLSDRFEQEGIRISPLTISRCFGITRSPHRPYVSTLDLMCKYLGYASFNHFSKESCELLSLALSNPEMSFHTGDFSFTALELCIRSGDWKGTSKLLNAFDPSRSNVQRMISFLGTTVRDISAKEELLSLLSKSEKGRTYYFEAFVDEDDPNSYFSDALMRFYLNDKHSAGEKLFSHAFWYAKKIYANKSIELHELDFVDQVDHSVDHCLEQLHFHQLSRLFEMRILREGISNNRIEVIDRIIHELLDLLPNYHPRNQSWLLYRTIKALGFTDNFHSIVSRNERFKAQLKCVYSEIGNFMNGVSDLAIQFTVHSIAKDDIELYTPCRVKNPIANETNSRVALENATALIYAEDQVKNYINANLPHFLRSTGQEWINNIGNKQ
jgi:hypothetical protein